MRYRSGCFERWLPASLKFEPQTSTGFFSEALPVGVLPVVILLAGPTEELPAATDHLEVLLEVAVA